MYKKMVDVYPFAAPEVLADVLRFAVNGGGQLTIRLDNTRGDATATFHAQVYASIGGNSGAYTATTAEDNGAAITGVTVVPGTFKEFTIHLRPGVDNFLLFRASGGVKAAVEIRQSECRLDLLSA